jgi:hypothetical protein
MSNPLDDTARRIAAPGTKLPEIAANVLDE